MSLSEEENLRIAREQEASMNDPSKINPPTRNTTNALGEDSGVTDDKLDGFETSSGMSMVDSGRTGQSGGGANPQAIPPQEGGDSDRSTSSDSFEGPGRGEDQALLQARDAPGSVNLTANQREVVPTADPEGERARNLLPLDQVGTGPQSTEPEQTDALGNTV